jgi:hypothetical protein
MAQNAHAGAAVPGAAVARLSNDSTAEDSASLTNGQRVAKRRCPGCARKCAKFVAVQGWHAGRARLLCKRCAGGLIIHRGRVAGLKLAPEVKGTAEARP